MIQSEHWSWVRRVSPRILMNLWELCDEIASFPMVVSKSKKDVASEWPTALPTLLRWEWLQRTDCKMCTMYNGTHRVTRSVEALPELEGADEVGRPAG